MRAERGRRTRHRPQVARVGDAVQGDDQRQLAGVGGAGEQVVGVRVVVGAHPQRQALVQRAAGEPVELGGAGLEHGHAPVGGELDGLADPLVVLDPGADVQGRGGHAGPQRLDHRVAAGDELGRVPGPRAARGPDGAGRRRGPAGRGRRRGGGRRPGAAAGAAEAAAPRGAARGGRGAWRRAGSAPCPRACAGRGRRCPGAACPTWSGRDPSGRRPPGGTGRALVRSTLQLPSRAFRGVLDRRRRSPPGRP